MYKKRFGTSKSNTKCNHHFINSTSDIINQLKNTSQNKNDLATRKKKKKLPPKIIEIIIKKLRRIILRGYYTNCINDG